MAEKMGAKIALGTLVAGGAGIGIFLLSRKAAAAEASADHHRREAEKAAQDAAGARAQAQAARAGADAARFAAEGAAVREQQARAAAAAQKQAGDAARAAAAHNKAVAEAQAAAARQARADARAAAEAAAATADQARRAALAREAQIKADAAQKAAAAQAQADREAKRAKAEADARAKAEKDATEQAEREGTERERRSREAEKRQREEEVKAQEAAEKQAQAQVEAGKAAAAGAALEAKRQIVAEAFNRLLGTVKEQSPGLSHQGAVNRAAAHMKRKGVVLDKPNPDKAFWRKTEGEIQQQVNQAVQSYQGTGTMKPQPAPPAPRPTVTSAQRQRNQSLITSMFNAVGRYATQAWQSRKGAKPSEAFAQAVRGTWIQALRAPLRAGGGQLSNENLLALPQAALVERLRGAALATEQDIDTRTFDRKAFLHKWQTMGPPNPAYSQIIKSGDTPVAGAALDNPYVPVEYDEVSIMQSSGGFGVPGAVGIA